MKNAPWFASSRPAVDSVIPRCSANIRASRTNWVERIPPLGWHTFHRGSSPGLERVLTVVGFGNRGIYSTVEAGDFEEIVRERLAETGETAIGAARRAGLPRDAIRSVLRGHPPNLLRATKICDALGLSLSVGSRQTVQRLGSVDADDSESRSLSPASDLERHTQGLVRAVAAAGGDPIPPEMRTTASRGPVVRHDSGAVEARRLTEAEAGSVAIPFAADVRLSAGSGQPVWDETAEMSVSVARTALAAWARPERLRCARVVGDSMAPTIGDGALVVLDSGRTEPLDGLVFGVHTVEGLVVKRLRRVDGRWHLENDNPVHESSPVTGEERILGQVAWTGPPGAGTWVDAEAVGEWRAATSEHAADSPDPSRARDRHAPPEVHRPPPERARRPVEREPPERERRDGGRQR